MCRSTKEHASMTHAKNAGSSCGTDVIPIEELRPRFVSPDLFQLWDRDVSVTYQPVFVGGRPSLTYRDRHRTLQFSGDEIRRVEVPDLGTVVSVTLVLTVDSGSTTFSLLLPRVHLPNHVGASTPIATEGITATQHLSVAPIFEQGQRDSYAVSRLDGTASLVILPL
jgi:hypothetical protein